MSSQALLLKESELDSFAFAIARNECGAKDDIATVLKQEGISFDAFAKLANDEVFQRKVQGFVKELTENGTSFQLKARLQAEELLKKQWYIIHDPDTAPAVAVKAIENTVRWAGLEPKVSQNAQAASQGAAFQLVININQPTSAAQASKIIDAEAEAYELEG